MVPVLGPYHNLKHGLLAITSHFRLNRLLEKVSTDYDDQGWWFAFFKCFFFQLFVFLLDFVPVFLTPDNQEVFFRKLKAVYFLLIYIILWSTSLHPVTLRVRLCYVMKLALIGNSNFFLPLIHLNHYSQRESINAYSNRQCFWKGIISMAWLFSCISKLSLLGSRELPTCILSNLILLHPLHPPAMTQTCQPIRSSTFINCVQVLLSSLAESYSLKN